MFQEENEINDLWRTPDADMADMTETYGGILMKRLTFLVNRGENDCFMVHGLDWATYAEGQDFSVITEDIIKLVDREFDAETRPAYLDFRFPDGTVVSLSA